MLAGPVVPQLHQFDEKDLNASVASASQLFAVSLSVVHVVRFLLESSTRLDIQSCKHLKEPELGDTPTRWHRALR